jgi:hypothetical protein
MALLIGFMDIIIKKLAANFKIVFLIIQPLALSLTLLVIKKVNIALVKPNYLFLSVLR